MKTFAAAVFCALGLLLSPLVSVTAQAQSLDLQPFDLKPDTSTDHTQRLNRAFRKARENGQSVVLPAGSLQFQGVVRIQGIDVSGQGPGTVLVPTDSRNAQLRLLGNASLRQLTIEEAPAARKPANLPRPFLVLDKTDGAALVDCRLIGVNSGVEVRASSNFQIRANTFNNFHGAAIRIVNGSHGATIHANQIEGRGHGIEVFSSDDQPEACRNLQISGNRIGPADGTSDVRGGGILVFGGNTIQISGNQIESRDGPGILAGHDPNRVSQPATDILIQGNQIVDSGSDIGDTAPAISLSGASNFPLVNVRVTGNQILRSRQNAVDVMGVARNVTIEGNDFNDIGGYGVFGEGEDLRDVFVRNNSFIGLDGGAVRLEPGEEGIFEIAGNYLRVLNRDGNTWEDAIHFFEVRGDTFTLRVRHNIHLDPNDEELLEAFVHAEDTGIEPIFLDNITPDENLIGQ